MNRWKVLGVLMAAMAFPAQADAPRLSLPIGCAIGLGCQVQNYVDDDPSGAAHDFACSGLTYDGHKGTDIRLRDIAAMRLGVSVLAAADGTVKAVRDGMADISIRDPGAASVDGKECGNGVLVEHGDGWVTQYCHMRNASISVKAGDKVVRGAKLGLVGLSGDTEFAHLHFEVRHGATVVDPFTSTAMGTASCGAERPRGMWEPSAATALAARPPTVLAAGFADRTLELRSLEQAAPDPPTAQGGALIAYVRVLGVRLGDVETLTMTSPNGTSFAQKGPVVLARDKVHWLSYIGRKRTTAAWPSGTYRARYKLERLGASILDQTFETTIR